MLVSVVLKSLNKWIFVLYITFFVYNYAVLRMINIAFEKISNLNCYVLNNLIYYAIILFNPILLFLILLTTIYFQESESKKRVERVVEEFRRWVQWINCATKNNEILFWRNFKSISINFKNNFYRSIWFLSSMSNCFW